MLQRSLSFCTLILTSIIISDAVASDKGCYGNIILETSDYANSWWDSDLMGELLELEPLGNDVTYKITCFGLVDCFFGGPITFRVIRNGIEEIYSGPPVLGSIGITITEPGHYRAYMEGSSLDNWIPVTMQFTIGGSPSFLISPYAILAGAWDPATATMRDDLRSNDQIPTQRETYDWHVAAPSSYVMQPDVLVPTGGNAVVDWVEVELRMNGTHALIQKTGALIKRDGSITASDGISPLRFHAPPGSYHLVIRHRNHLAIMTDAIVFTEGSNELDLRDASIPLLGNEPAKPLNTYRGLWPGNVYDQYPNLAAIAYAGPNNDRDAILQFIGGVIPTNTVTAGYSNCDVNLDGVVRYTGPNNDRDQILQTIGGTVPTAVRSEQVPSGW